MTTKEYRKQNEKVTEKDITASIRAYLNAKKIFHWKNWAGLGSQKGVPDIIGVLPNGRALLIEVKRPNGKLSEHQDNFLENASKLGALAFVARDINDLQLRGL